MLVVALVSALAGPPQDPPPVPDADNFRQWQTRIEPDATELAYLRVAWRNEFWPAVLEARELGRPILFWTMNGHPLGCT